MISYVLDTHALILGAVAPNKIGADARRALARVERGQDRAYVPAAVLAEVVLLRDLGRTRLSIADIKLLLDESSHLQFLALDLGQMEIFATLPSIRDPFDRMIVSAALATGSRLITKDASVTDLGLVHVVW